MDLWLFVASIAYDSFSRSQSRPAYAAAPARATAPTILGPVPPKRLAFWLRRAVPGPVTFDPVPLEEDPPDEDPSDDEPEDPEEDDEPVSRASTP
jgi:hypothetical protein